MKPEKRTNMNRMTAANLSGRRQILEGDRSLRRRIERLKNKQNG
jgi:hypothetical protein